jgi:hypothetical protein
MRHLLSSFLALHWAVAFSLLAFLCIDGSRGAAVALGMLGASSENAQFAQPGNAAMVASLATAFLVVAMLFCWAFVELFVDDESRPEGADNVIRIAFVAAAAVLSLILVGGAMQGIDGLFTVVAVHLAALLTCYMAILAERWSASVGARSDDEARIRIAVLSMAQGAAHNSMLARISGRGDAKPGKGR